jgi:hypothetical protein
MFVFIQVSSMNTSGPGLSPGWRSRHSARAAATSGRSCSAARRDFFDCQVQARERLVHQSFAGGDFVRLIQPTPQFGGGRVRPRRDLGTDGLVQRRQLGRQVAPLGARGSLAGEL